MQVGNEKKQKSLHALGLVPARDMDIATLHQQPDGTTACPFTGSAGRLRRKADEALGAACALSRQLRLWGFAMRAMEEQCRKYDSRMMCRDNHQDIPGKQT